MKNLLVCACLLGAWCGGLAMMSPATGQTPADSNSARSGQTSSLGPTYSVALRRVPLAQALDTLVARTDMDLIYGARIVEGRVVYCTRANAPIEELLQCILKSAGMDYIQSSSGAYVVIEAPEQSPRRGTLAGRIVDDATGRPLPSASVLLADASVGTSTGEDGAFAFASLLPGWHRVAVSYVGYRPAVDSVYVPPDGRQRVRIPLHRDVAQLEPIVVDGVTQRLPASRLGRSGMDLTDASSPVSDRDVIRGFRQMTGVAVEFPLADIHIQGGGAGSHLTLLDGAPVRNPVSLGRHLSAFSPLALDRIDVQKAGYGASAGSYLGGLIDVRHDLGRSSSPSVQAQAGPTSLNASLSFPLERTDLRRRNAGTPSGSRVMGAVRQSAWDMYRSPSVASLLERWNVVDPLLAATWIAGADADVREDLPSLTVLQHRPDVLFSDLHLAAELQLRPFETLYVSAYRARNRIQAELGLDLRSLGNETEAAGAGGRTAIFAADPRVALSEDIYDWTNWAGSLRYHRFVGDRSRIGIRAAASHHVSFYDYRFQLRPRQAGESPDDVLSALRSTLADAAGTDERNQIAEWTVETTLDHSFSPGYHLDAGGFVGRTVSGFELQNQFVGPFEHDVAAWMAGGYATLDVSLGWELTLQPGVRWTYLHTREQGYVEPRVALRYEQAGSRIGEYAVRLAGGLYRQFTQQYELSSAGPTAVVPSVRFWLPMDRTVAPPMAYHLAVDALFLPHPRWSVRAEAYYKALPRVLRVDYPALPDPVETDVPAEQVAQRAFVANGRGTSYGIGLDLAYEVDALDVSLGYDWGRSQRTYPGRFGGDAVPAPWNDPHRLMLDGQIPVDAGWSVQVAASQQWGGRWAFRRAYYDYLSQRSGSNPEGLDLSRPEDDRQPLHRRVDLHVHYRAGMNGVRIRASVGLLNVLNRTNAFDQSLVATDAQDPSREMSGVGESSRLAPPFDTRSRSLPGRLPTASLLLQF